MTKMSAAIMGLLERYERAQLQASRKQVQGHCTLTTNDLNAKSLEKPRGTNSRRRKDLERHRLRQTLSIPSQVDTKGVLVRHSLFEVETLWWDAKKTLRNPFLLCGNNSAVPGRYFSGGSWGIASPSLRGSDAP